MDAGTDYVVDLYGISNPTQNQLKTGLTIIGGQTVSGNRSYTNVFFERGNLYTITTVPNTETNQNLPTITPTTIQTTTNFDLPVATAGGTLLTAHFDHIKLIYNQDMQNALVDSTADFEAFDVEAGLAFFYNEVTKGATFDLELINMFTPTSSVTPFVSNFKVQLIKNKNILNEIDYDVNGNSFIPVVFPAFQVVAPTNIAILQATSPHLLSITLDKNIKA